MSDSVAPDSDTSGSVIRWTEDDGVVSLTFDDPTQAVNTVNARYLELFEDVLARLDADRESIRGVIVTSGKGSFFAGGTCATCSPPDRMRRQNSPPSPPRSRPGCAGWRRWGFRWLRRSTAAPSNLRWPAITGLPSTHPV